MNIIERRVQRSIFVKGSSSYRLIMPNYTPHKWWECDVFAVTRAGYFHEFEIKATVSDFRADAKKRDRDTYEWIDPDPSKRNYRDRKNPEICKVIPGRSKHDRLADGEHVGPSRFWYVMPTDLIDVAEIPSWAGLKWYEPYDNHPLCRLKIVKAAPQIHRQKISEKIITHAMGVSYFRYWTERQRCDDAQAAIEKLVGAA